MASYRGTEAYDLSLFEPQVIKQPTPIKGDIDKTIEEFEKTTRKADLDQKELAAKKEANALKRVRVLQQRKLAKTVSFIVVALGCLSLMIMARAQTDNLTREINATKTKIKNAQSENVRLTTEMNSLVSIDRVETYAEEVLGMVKAQRGQITYIDMSNGDAVVLSGGKSSQDGNLTTKLKELFAYLP